MFTSQIPPGTGLLLVQGHESRLDAAIHMFFVNYDLAIIWLDNRYQVVDKCLAHRWHPFYMPTAPARFILEIHPDHLADFNIGEVVEISDV